MVFAGTGVWKSKRGTAFLGRRCVFINDAQCSCNARDKLISANDTSYAYDNYLCIQQLRGSDNALFHSYVWDPTEPIATRPLIFLPAAFSLAYYFHDGNKNVSDLVDTQENVVHYAYTPFGPSAPSENPYTFSSEYMDDGLGLVHYNYRHYSAQWGRWLRKDPLNRDDSKSEYHLINNMTYSYDVLGLKPAYEIIDDFGITPSLGGSLLITRNPPVPNEDILKGIRCHLIKESFDKWYEEDADISWVGKLTPCPSEMTKVEENGKISCQNPDENEWEQSDLKFAVTQWWGEFHPGGSYELRTKTTSKSGNQCIYDACCKLITTIPGAGSADYSSPNAPQSSHMSDDVTPFLWARELDQCFPNARPSYVERYYQRRPSH